MTKEEFLNKRNQIVAEIKADGGINTSDAIKELDDFDKAWEDAGNIPYCGWCESFHIKMKPCWM